MSDTAFESLLRRDRYAVMAALFLLTVLAWAYVLWLARHMDMPAMPGMDMNSMSMGNMAAMAPQIRPWAFADLLFSFTMWTVMMVGMMLPSVAPVILLYVLVGRQAEAMHKPLAATGWFAGGYLLAWAGFSLIATLLQAGLVQAALLTPELATANNILGGAILIAAGLYQWSPLKYKCLASCRAPLFFIQRHGGFQRQALPSLGLGLRHGLYCIGCCWALMLLLFAGGVMNIVWIASIAALVLMEKVLSDGRNVSRVVGAGLIIGGLVLAFGGFPPLT
jgi:predicted metal-binding membrane protein